VPPVSTGAALFDTAPPGVAGLDDDDPPHAVSVIANESAASKVEGRRKGEAGKGSVLMSDASLVE
jgi:hypothetical protein